jgi:large subunit ribosomal protein L5
LSTQTPKKAPRLREFYRTKAIPNLKTRFGYKNVMQVPRLDKIVVNMGVGKASAEPKLLDEAVAQLRAITGQQPLVIRSKKAISNFKLRANIPIGAKVTMRGDMMLEFFDRLVSIAIPRMRDFRGISRKCVDGHGNFTLGVKEQVVFLEIDRDKVSRVSGMDITICTTARNNEECLALLEEMGVPFRK